GFRKSLEAAPVIGGRLRTWRQLHQAAPDAPNLEGEPSTRPAPEPGIVAGARASKELWEDDPALATQYEKEKTAMLKAYSALRSRGISVQPVFLRPCLSNLTSDELTRLSEYNKRGEGMVPLTQQEAEDADLPAGVKLPSIERQHQKRKAGVGPQNAYEQYSRLN
ncbi:MAG: hypothetical protein ACYC63_07810, partial [Armatimonadota bacterium]